MNIYKLAQRFSPETGKPSHMEREATEQVICDYSGEILGDIGMSPFYVLSLNFDTDWYYSETPELEKFYRKEFKLKKDEDWPDYDIKQSLFEGDYHFQYNSEGTDLSVALADEWVRNVENKESPFYDIDNIARAFRVARYRTVIKLLKSKKFTFKQLGLVDE